MTRVAVEIEAPSWRRDVLRTADVVRRAARCALGGVKAETLTVLLADNAVVRNLNARFRDQDKPTNVLAFPSPPASGGHLGDLALAHGVCAHEAAAQGKSLADHLSHLVVHGVLHLMGHDHLNDDEAEAMEAEERRLLARLGVADPYAPRELEAVRGG